MSAHADPRPLKICPFCAEQILAAAKKCRFCGEFMPESEVEERAPKGRKPQWNPGTAALLSLLLPGAGQIYIGRILTGLCCIPAVITCYYLNVWVGLAAHLACVINASHQKQDPAVTERIGKGILFAIAGTAAVIAIGFGVQVFNVLGSLRSWRLEPNVSDTELTVFVAAKNAFREMHRNGEISHIKSDSVKSIGPGNYRAEFDYTPPGGPVRQIECTVNGPTVTCSN